ncbi:MAG: hypothetical protein R2745_07490 [Vicinamibacterales bacterium]
MTSWWRSWGRRWTGARRTLTAAAALAGAMHGRAEAQTAPVGRWHVAIGVTRPLIDPVEGDFQPAAGPAGLTVSGLTFPHVAIGAGVGRAEFALGYRKLGVLRFETGDGRSRGNTHSNALEAGIRTSLLQHGRMRVQARAGAQVVRTIAAVPSDAAWRFTGGLNTWRVLPLLGVGAEVRLSRRSAVRVDYAPVLGRLGTPDRTGRYRQQVVGIDVVRTW